MDNMCTAWWTTNPPAGPLAARCGAGLELLQRPRRTHRPPQEARSTGLPRRGAGAVGTRGRTTDHLGGATRRAAADDAVACRTPTVGSSPSRPRRVPPGVAAGCRDGAAPSGRWPVPDSSGTVGRRSGEGPSDAYSEGPSSCPDPVTHNVAHMSTGRGPPNGRTHHPVERYVRLFPQKLSPPCARSHDLCGAGASPLWTPCARPGGRRRPPHATPAARHPRLRDLLAGTTRPALRAGGGTRRKRRLGAPVLPRAQGQAAGASTGCRSTETSGRAPEPSVKMTPRRGGTSP